MSATYAARWYLVATHFRREYELARLQKMTKGAPRGVTPYERAVNRTAKKFHLSAASVRRAIKLFSA